MTNIEQINNKPGLTAALLCILCILFLGSCQRNEGNFDTNAAEAAAGDNDRKNSETNEEAGMDTTLHRPARTDGGAVQQDSTTKAPGTTSPGKQSPDHPFIMDAAEAGLAEVKLGNLAVEQASSADVRKFAQMMVKDHSSANDELKKLVTPRGIELPADCQKCQPKYDELKALKGKDFDAKYAEMMVKDHKDAIAKFETESKNGGDPDVTKWAAGKVPVLKHHLTEAESLDKKKGK